MHKQCIVSLNFNNSVSRKCYIHYVAVLSFWRSEKCTIVDVSQILFLRDVRNFTSLWKTSFQTFKWCTMSKKEETIRKTVSQNPYILGKSKIKIRPCKSCHVRLWRQVWQILMYTTSTVKLVVMCIKIRPWLLSVRKELDISTRRFDKQRKNSNSFLLMTLV